MLLKFIRFIFYTHISTMVIHALNLQNVVDYLLIMIYRSLIKTNLMS